VWLLRITVSSLPYITDIYGQETLRKTQAIRKRLTFTLNYWVGDAKTRRGKKKFDNFTIQFGSERHVSISDMYSLYGENKWQHDPLPDATRCQDISYFLFLWNAVWCILLYALLNTRVAHSRNLQLPVSSKQNAQYILKQELN
jgi:hypothetical protein